MRGHGVIKVIALPYKSCKEKIRITKKNLGKYYIEDLGGVLLLKAREENGRA